MAGVARRNYQRKRRRPELVLMIAISVAALIALCSAFAVSFNAYSYRAAFADWYEAQNRAQKLAVWSDMLTMEYSTLATSEYISRIAQDELSMVLGDYRSSSVLLTTDLPAVSVLREPAL